MVEGGLRRVLKGGRWRFICSRKKIGGCLRREDGLGCGVCGRTSFSFCFSQFFLGLWEGSNLAQSSYTGAKRSAVSPVGADRLMLPNKTPGGADG